MKNKSLCWECQMRKIEYTTTITGSPMKNGLCRDCFEMKGARRNGSIRWEKRTDEMKENTHETKHGPRD